MVVVVVVVAAAVAAATAAALCSYSSCTRESEKDTLLLPITLPNVDQFSKFFSFLGRLPKVDLIILEGEKCPSVRPSVLPSVRPQKVSSI